MAKEDEKWLYQMMNTLSPGDAVYRYSVAIKQYVKGVVISKDYSHACISWFDGSFQYAGFNESYLVYIPDYLRKRHGFDS